ncbi:hypothetical protein EV663_10116 [Rhodovulum bhavnagarense]|uniref:Uncharacterized protein n=1 Tax=Rhodovulum bhavnagarense TaxID=992286 RepID=A0A4V2SWL4_9RHOB|nr:hypothetical protein [Rhodovulum bhavnagarense]TCP62756.1 hypothetical protein EV663_10116 [Rhodovulum bhavnagarense]
MANDERNTPLKIGFLSSKKEEGDIGATDMIALGLSLLWLVIAGAFFTFARFGSTRPSFDPLTFILVLLAVVMPVALIWVGASAAKSARIMREESARLQAAIDAMRKTYIQQQQNAGMEVSRPSIEQKLEELARAQKQTETVIATFASRRGETPAPALATTAVSPPETDADQPALALGTPPEDLSPPLATADFLRALNFPETAEDREGFRALRRALEDRIAGKLVRAAQDVLTLLSQDGIYMDDLRPDRAHPEIWRKFAHGERGPGVAALGGVRDRSCLALAAGRMKQDPIFRDAAHHFLRQFDKVLAEFEQAASDQEISDLAETRTARAFMLLGRVTGMFG